MIARTIGVAVEIPQPYGEFLAAIWNRYERHAPRMPPHITLLPPVDVELDVVESVREHLAAVSKTFSPFEIELSGAGTFRPVSPVVFSEVTKGAQELTELEERIRRGPLAVETRFEYHPHVTVAFGVSESALDAAAAELEGFQATFHVDQFRLYVLSTREGDRDSWAPMADFPLG